MRIGGKEFDLKKNTYTVSYTHLLFFSGFSCIVTLPYLLFNYHPMTGTQMLALLGAGLAAAGGQFGITAAYYHAPAKEISIYDYSQIIFSTILGYFLFGQVPDK